MRIENDKYLLTHDGDQYVLQMKTVVKDSQLLKDKSLVGSVKLSTEKRYYPKISQAFNRIVDLSLADDLEVNTMLDISMKIDEIGSELLEAVKGNYEQIKGKS
tara:strand:+ start:1225 stop:1533 length:309 start_codon:yes stop_codon:yes gene_type:complete